MDPSRNIFLFCKVACVAFFISLTVNPFNLHFIPIYSSRHLRVSVQCHSNGERDTHAPLKSSMLRATTDFEKDNCSTVRKTVGKDKRRHNFAQLPVVQSKAQIPVTGLTGLLSLAVSLLGKHPLRTPNTDLTYALWTPFMVSISACVFLFMNMLFSKCT